LVPLCLPISRWLPCFWSSFLFYSLLQFPFWWIVSFYSALLMHPTSVVFTGSISTPSTVLLGLLERVLCAHPVRLPCIYHAGYWRCFCLPVLIASGFCPAVYCPLIFTKFEFVPPYTVYSVLGWWCPTALCTPPTFGYRDNSVGITTGYGRSRDLSSPQRPDRLWSLPSRLSDGYWGSLPR
jgi:hypothetical protein